jgi:hypothetical protein
MFRLVVTWLTFFGMVLGVPGTLCTALCLVGEVPFGEAVFFSRNSVACLPIVAALVRTPLLPCPTVGVSGPCFGGTSFTTATSSQTRALASDPLVITLDEAAPASDNGAAVSLLLFWANRLVASLPFLFPFSLLA